MVKFFGHTVINGSCRIFSVFAFLSGGHTCLYEADSPLELRLLGSTIDDAAGSASPPEPHRQRRRQPQGQGTKTARSQSQHSTALPIGSRRRGSKTRPREGRQAGEMAKVPPWGRVCETKEQRMAEGSESCASVLNDRTRYPRWTEAMVGETYSPPT